ncbi:MAG: thioesterase family protein [Steroidobacter sp.]
MSSRPFVHYLRTRYCECDAQQVVFNSRYGEYTDVAVAEFIRAIGFGPEMKTGEFDVQLVKQTTQWRAPARYDDVLEISVEARHFGNTSFTLACEFRIAGQESVIATVETVYVHVDHQTLQKQTLPDFRREALQRGAPGVAVDHAGYLR